MEIIVIGIVVLIVIAVLRNIFGGGSESERKRDDWPYYAKKPLSNVEQILYHRMVKALPEHIILAQVQVSRLLGVKRGFSFHEWNNRINRLSLDFVICQKDAKIIAAVELDDATHNSESRIETDAKKNRALESAGVKIIRWQAKALPSVEEIRQSINGAGNTQTGDDEMRLEPTL